MDRLRHKARWLTIGLLLIGLTSCVGMIVGAAVDTTIEVAKVPFKVAGAAVDVMVPDNDDEEDNR